MIEKLKKFWEWFCNPVIKREVFNDSRWCLVERDKNGIDTYTFSKHMFIGYLEDYLQEKHNVFIGIVDRKKSESFIDARYRNLVNEIMELDNEK
jgi:hypothetical protein